MEGVFSGMLLKSAGSAIGDVKLGYSNALTMGLIANGSPKVDDNPLLFSRLENWESVGRVVATVPGGFHGCIDASMLASERSASDL